MKISARSVLMAGVATVTASAVVIAPSVQPPPPPTPTIQLAAAVQPLVTTGSHNPVGMGAADPDTAELRHRPPPPPPQIVVPTPGSIGSTHHQHLQRGRTVGALGFPSSPSTRSAGFRMSVGWHHKSTSSTTSASRSSVASSSTSPTGSMGTSASPRAWSMSASTPSTRSSIWRTHQTRLLAAAAAAIAAATPDRPPMSLPL